MISLIDKVDPRFGTTQIADAFMLIGLARFNPTNFGVSAEDGQRQNRAAALIELERVLMSMRDKPTAFHG